MNKLHEVFAGDTSRSARGRALPVAAVLLAGFLGSCAPLSAASDSRAVEEFQRAEQLFLAGRLAEAVPLYRRVITSGDDELRASSYARLADAHGRLGRLVEAVQDGRRARALLEKSGGGPLRSVEIHLGEAYLGLGHYAAAADCLRRGLAIEVPPLPLTDLLRALSSLAHCAEQRGDPAGALRAWTQVEALAFEELDRPAADLRPEQRAECVSRLADSYFFQHKHPQAIARLEGLLRLQDRRGDRAGQRDTCRRLAGHHAARDEPGLAEKYLRQALELHDRPEDAGGRVLRGDLGVEFAEALQKQGKQAEAAAARAEAAEQYRAVLKKVGDGRAESAWGVTAFWKLVKLYQRSSQFRRALELADEQSGRWASLALLDPNKVGSERGSLQFLLGAYPAALPLLRKAVEELGKQDPVNLIDLPQALLNLGIAEHRTADWANREPWLKGLERADGAASRVLDLYRGHQLPEDLVVAEAHHLRGVCAAERGFYHLAVAHLRAGVAVGEKLGRAADRLRSMLLLDMALLHKSQGDPDEALRLCREAREVFRRSGEADEMEMAAFDAAEVVLSSARGRLDEAYERAQRLLALCRKHGVKAGPLLEIALHCEGLHELASGDAQAAEKVWGQLREIQEKEGASPLLPRTLNYLALTARRQGRWDEAESLYRRAAQMQRGNEQALAVTHYLSLWGLAGVARHWGRPNEERELLQQAVAVVEGARLRTYGAAAERARYFAQFAPGYERLAASCLEGGDVEAALAAAVRGRSRTLLDQLRMANLDPLAGLPGPQGEELRRREEQTRRRLDGLQARARLGMDAADARRRKQLLAELGQAQQDYATAWREVLNASPVYRQLAAEDPARELGAAGRDRLLGPKTLLLVYHVGRERSHLLILAGRDFSPRAIELVLPAGAAAAGPARKAPVTEREARALVDGYLRHLQDPYFSPTEGLSLNPSNPTRPEPPLPIERIAEVLLPEAARDCIRASGAECLVVAPDGPLHKLPLEALVLKAGPKPRYVLDDFPPIAYAPSAALLPLQAQRPALPAGPLSLLTVCNPAYRQGRPPYRPGADVPPQFHAQLPPLPFTVVESQRIRNLFPPARMTALEGLAATEGAVKAAIAGKRIIHLAVHGFADERFGNLYGGLLLAPPASEEEARKEDGLLSLHEIYRLPLQDCELAVLSACATNVGPQQPLEAGATLASGFLGAGARRVVASHWRVDDEATAALMGAFFAEILQAARRNEPVRYAAALQAARRKVRDQWDWSAPFFWAPFVVVGPPDAVVPRPPR